MVRELCRRAGLPDSQIDVSALHGYLVTALESPRASIAPLARHFGFDAVESEGVIRFQPRDRRPAATLTLDDLVAGSDADAEVIELVRAQETELPQALKWQLVRSDEEFDAMSVEACRATGAALRVTSETFAITTPAGDAERRRRRARSSRNGSAARPRPSGCRRRTSPSTRATSCGSITTAGSRPCG